MFQYWLWIELHSTSAVEELGIVLLFACRGFLPEAVDGPFIAGDHQAIGGDGGEP